MPGLGIDCLALRQIFSPSELEALPIAVPRHLFYPEDAQPVEKALCVIILHSLAFRL